MLEDVSARRKERESLPLVERLGTRITHAFFVCQQVEESRGMVHDVFVGARRKGRWPAGAQCHWKGWAVDTGMVHRRMFKDVSQGRTSKAIT